MRRLTVCCVPWITINNIIKGGNENEILLAHGQHCETPWLALFKDPPWRIVPIIQRIRLCRELRDLVKGKRSVFLEMTRCFIAYCAAIKHLLGRQLSHPLLFFCSALPHRSDRLEVLFTNLCARPGQSMNQKQPCADIVAVPRTVDALQLYAVQGL